MTIEERLQTVEQELSLTKAMLARVLNESSTTDIRARSITLTFDDGSDAATLRVLYEHEVPQGVILELVGADSGASIELRDNMAGPQLFLGKEVRLGAVFDDPIFMNERYGIVVGDHRAALTVGSLDGQVCLYLCDEDGRVIWSAP